MPVTWKYTPPTSNAAERMAIAAPIAAHKVAEDILADSQQLVPVDSGALKDSGKVTQDGSAAVVSYDVLSDDDGYPYGIRQHEDMTLEHPNGGQAKFLEQPFHENPEERLAVAAEVLREAISR